MIIKVQTEDFSLQEEADALRADHNGAGALVTFSGLVRDDGWIEEMVLEHYPAMTEKQLHDIAAESMSRFDILDCLIIHRHGTLKPGEQIMMVATLSLHRAEAFAAAEFLMDWLKTKAPFWKQETGGGKTRWVEAKETDDAAADRWDKPGV